MSHRKTLLLYFILTLLIILVLAFFSNSYAQEVREVSSSHIALALPHDTLTYSRDIVALRDQNWAQQNVWMAFWMDSSASEVPPFADTTIIAAMDSLDVLTGLLDAKLASKDSQIDSLTARTRYLETETVLARSRMWQVVSAIQELLARY